MRIKQKILLYILCVIILSSCTKHSATDPRIENNTNTDDVNGLALGYDGTVYYGNKSFTGKITKEQIEKLWKEMSANKTVYKTSSYDSITGELKEDASYYESSWNNGQTPRTEFRRCIVCNYNGKNYIAGIYWDNKTGIGMRIRYRLIIVDDKGAEQAWYGGGSDENIIPDEKVNDWVKYWFVFGYIKL